MGDLTTGEATERLDPGPVPVLAEHDEPPPIDPPSAFPDGVELTRLIARAQLSLAQALEIGTNVLAEAVRRAEPGTGSSDGGQVTLGPVVLGADGRVVRPGGDAHRVRPPAGDPGVGAVLAQLADAARPRARGAGPAAAQLLAELDRAVAELPVAGVPAVARSLRDAATALDREAVRAEIGALVRAIGTETGPAGGAGPAGRPAARAPAARAGRARDRRSGSSWRRIGAWVLSVVVLAGAVLLEVALLRDSITADVRLLLDAGRSGSSPSAAPRPDGRPVPAPAPAAAGAVLGVDLRPLASCVPGAACTVRLVVRLAPGAERQVVTWSYRLVDRCTGAAETSPGGSVTVPALVQRAAVVGTVSLPAVHGVAVIAVTGQPAAAASRPLITGSCLSQP